MPTFNRRRFIPLALKYFFSQTYPNKELIIIDDGSDCVRDLIPSDDCIQFYYFNRKISLGVKLNLGCAYANGEIIAHFDDDDWYAPWRLSYQVEALREKNKGICGINRLYYYDLRTGGAYQYVYPDTQRLWLSGSSLCYRKSLWEGHRFKNIDVGMDALFVWGIPLERIKILENPAFAVHMIHSSNSNAKKVNGPWWKAIPIDETKKIMGEDFSCYEIFTAC